MPSVLTHLQLNLFLCSVLPRLPNLNIYDLRSVRVSDNDRRRRLNASVICELRANDSDSAFGRTRNCSVIYKLTVADHANTAAAKRTALRAIASQHRAAFNAHRAARHQTNHASA